MCLDVAAADTHPVDLFDCKPGDSNQDWSFDEAAGAGAVRHGGRCLARF